MNGHKSTDALSDNLLQATMQIRNFCNNTCYGFDTHNYCALDLSSRKSNICFGDSGGCLMYLINGKWQLFGITSIVLAQVSPRVCLNKLPSFYTIVPNYLEWIKSII